MDIKLVTDPYACTMHIVSPLPGLGGGILWWPTAYSLFNQLFSRDNLNKHGLTQVHPENGH